jgi:hypothetical protein
VFDRKLLPFRLCFSTHIVRFQPLTGVLEFPIGLDVHSAPEDRNRTVIVVLLIILKSVCVQKQITGVDEVTTSIVLARRDKDFLINWNYLTKRNIISKEVELFQ